MNDDCGCRELIFLGKEIIKAYYQFIYFHKKNKIHTTKPILLLK